MTQRSQRLDLPYIQASQAQKHITHNEALKALDVIVQLSVIEDTLSAPPSDPDDNARYIVGTSASAQWAEKETQIACYENGGWLFYPPQTGWRAWVTSQQVMSVFDGTAWQRQSERTQLDNITHFGMNAQTSTDVPFVAHIPQAHWQFVALDEGGTGSIIHSLNRANDTADMGFTFQTDGTTHGVLGFFRDADFKISTSRDGTNFIDALRIDGATGIATYPQRPVFKGTTNHDNYIAADTWTKIAINELSMNTQNIFDSDDNVFTAPVDGLYVFSGQSVFKHHETTSTNMAVRFVRNQSIEIPESVHQSQGPLTDGTSLQKTDAIIALDAGDTVAMQVMFTDHPAYVHKNKTMFWGYLLP